MLASATLSVESCDNAIAIVGTIPYVSDKKSILCKDMGAPITRGKVTANPLEDEVSAISLAEDSSNAGTLYELIFRS